LDGDTAVYVLYVYVEGTTGPGVLELELLDEEELEELLFLPPQATMLTDMAAHISNANVAFKFLFMSYLQKK
jgi:hypothetical protein